MNMDHLLSLWHAEEAAARMKGWDFSHIEGRYEQPDNLPWHYREEVLACLRPDMRVLDLDTGGGEILLSLGHPPSLLTVTEAYEPNVQLCRETLSPLGVDVRQADAAGPLPFADASFDLVLNRHGSFNAPEIARVLRPGGLFITQQVGAENDRELVELLMGESPLVFPEQYLSAAEEKFRLAGMEILRSDESFGPIRFFDVGALVWFARIIEWEFEGFSVDSCLPGLIRAQEMIEKQGFAEGRTHRFFLIARKP